MTRDLEKSPEVKATPGSRASRTGRLWQGAWRLLLAITAVCVVVPFAPVMPGAELDHAWAWAMNVAVAQGLAFGRELVFTFGPYAAVYTGTYHPATDALMVGGGLVAGVALGAMLFVVCRPAPWPVLVAIWVALATLVQLRDHLFLLLPLLVSIHVLQSVQSVQGEPAGGRWRRVAASALPFVPFGLLAVVKGSFLIGCIAATVLCTLLFALRGRWAQALAVLVTVGLSTLAFWRLAGQSAADLPAYLRGVAEVSAGYSEAMALDGARREIVYFVVAGIALLVAMVRSEGTSVTARVFLVLTFSIFLFLAFKAGFVRHDLHALIAGVSLLLATLLAIATLPRAPWAAALVLALLAWMHIDSHHAKTSTASLAEGIGRPYRIAWQGITTRIADPQALPRAYAERVAALRTETRLPALDGGSDIYPFHQSHLLASGNRWQPRPVPQSYNAYTPALLERNRRHLEGAGAPRNVFFRIDPIDGRLPALDDGPSWLPLLARYRPAGLDEGWLVLRRQDAPAAPAPVGLSKAAHRLGEVVPVAPGPTPLWARLTLRPSLPGRIAGVLLKPGRLRIDLTLANGTKRSLRIASGLTSAGFMLSPLVESTAEFGLLYGGGGYLADKHVVSFAIVAEGGDWSWEPGFELELARLPEPAVPADMPGLLHLDRPLPDGEVGEVAAAPACAGSIDAVNGQSPPAPPFSASGLLQVQGWMARSVAPAAVPAQRLLVLGAGDGRRRFVPLQPRPRPDVGAHFGQPALDASGWAASVDVGSLDGDVTIGLAYRDGGRILVCPQPLLPGRIRAVARAGQN